MNLEKVYGFILFVTFPKIFSDPKIYSIKSGEILRDKLAGALILIVTEIRTLRDVFREVKKLEEIDKAKMILGPYDIMVTVKDSTKEEIQNTLVNNIRDIDGVKQTVTNIYIED